MNDEALLREAHRVLRSLIQRTRRALEEDRDPNYIPTLRVINVTTLAEDPLHGDAAALLDTLTTRLKPSPHGNVGGDLVATLETLEAIDAKGYTTTPLYGDLFLAEKSGRVWLVEDHGAIVPLGPGVLKALKAELDKRV